MFIKILLNYILGYVNIVVEGYFIERFINICRSKNILLWNMNREKSSILHTNIGIKDFKNIRKIAKKTKCKVNIKSKRGFPFLFNRYKKRKIFFILLVLVFILLGVSSNFVWNIDVITKSNISEEELIKDLNECGLQIGKIKSSLDLNKIVNEIRLKRDDIAWIGISIKGTNALIEVVEATEKPEIINKDEYCNIVSDKEGVITKINVQNGTALVKVGDVVKKGTILVGGWIEGKYTGVRNLHSVADIEAKVWYTKNKKVYFKQDVTRDTGNTETKYRINFNNFKINLYKTLSKFENYDTIEENKKIKLFSNFYLPIEITKITNKETVTEQVTYTEQQLKENTISELEEELNKEIGENKNVINKHVNINKENDYIEVELIYEVLETIGTKEKLVF